MSDQGRSPAPTVRGVEIDDRRTPEAELGPVVAAGRAAVVHEAGPGRVLRRHPDERDLTVESRLMVHLREQGYPVPEVHRVGPGEQVFERVEGPTMLADLGAHPWRVGAHARTLADLHRRLHEIAAPAFLPAHPLGGEVLVHMDLHPGNVICSPDGPVVIDWTNGRAGRAEVDVAMTWVLMGAFEQDPPPPDLPWLRRLRDRAVRTIEDPIRRRLVATFLASSGVEPAARAALPEVAEIRLADRAVRPAEADAIRALVAREGSASR